MQNIPSRANRKAQSFRVYNNNNDDNNSNLLAYFQLQQSARRGPRSSPKTIVPVVTERGTRKSRGNCLLHIIHIYIITTLSFGMYTCTRLLNNGGSRVNN